MPSVPKVKIDGCLSPTFSPEDPSEGSKASSPTIRVNEQ